MVYNTWLNQNAYLEDDKPIRGFSRVYDLALIHGQDLSTTATAFGHYSTNEFEMNWVYIFWLMILAVEDTRNGAWNISQGRNKNPNLYKRIVQAIAAKKCGTDNADDRKKIKDYVKAGLRFSLDQQQDILDAIDELKANNVKDKEKKEAAKKKKSPPAATRPKYDSYIALLDLSLKYNKRVGDAVPGFPELSGLQTNPYHDEIEPDFETIDEECNLLETNQMDLLRETFPDGTVPKVKLFMTPIPSEEEPEKLVGYLVQFVVFDPTWNPGKTFNTMKDWEGPLTELFPRYAVVPTENFPTSNFSMEKYCQILCDFQKFQVLPENINQVWGIDDLEDYSSRLHVSQILTPEIALGRLRAAGGDTGLLDAILRKRSNLSSDPAITPYTLEHNTYFFEPERIFWYDEKKLGLLEYYFPGIKAKDPTVVDPRLHNPNPLIKLAEERLIILRNEVYQRCPELEQQIVTNNHLTQLHNDARVARQRLLQICPPNQLEIAKRFRKLKEDVGVNWRLHLSDDEARDLKQYELHREKTLEIRKLFMQRFADLCNLEGHVKFLPIPEPLKHMLLWYSQHARDYNDRNFEVYLADPEMGFFGNSMMNTFESLYYHFRLSQPRITTLLEGLYSVYSVDFDSDDKLKFNLLLTGVHAAGKSKHVVEMGQKLFIPGTWTAIDKITGAADTTDFGIEMVVRFLDEAPRYYLDPKAASRNPEKTQQKQTALSKGETRSRIFEHRTGADGRSYRDARDVISRQNYVEAGCSNMPYASETAITSRFCARTMADAARIKDMSKMNTYTPDELALLPQYVERFRRIQFFSAISKQAIGVMAICEPEMQLWEELSSRIIDNLFIWTGQNGKLDRHKKRMRLFAEQLTNRLAAHLTWDIRGAPYFGQPFQIKHLEYFQRVNYVTPPIVLFTLTLLCEDLVDQDAANVMNALMIKAHLDKYLVDEDGQPCEFNPYNVYCQDAKNTVPFRKVKFNAGKDQEYSQTLVDLNYIQFNESADTLAKSLAALTEPRLTPKQIEGVLQRLKDRTFVPRVGPDKRNGYALTPQDDLLSHKYQQIEKPTLTIGGLHNTLSEFCNVCEKRYRRAVCARFKNLPSTIETMSDYDLEQLQAKMEFGQWQFVLFHLHPELGLIDRNDLNSVVETKVIKRQLDTISTQDLSRVISAISDYTRDTEVPLVQQIHNLQLNAGHIDLLLHALNENYFAVPGQKVWIQQAYGISENNIPMLNDQLISEFNDKVKDPISLPFVKYEYRPPRVSFCPLGLAMLDRTAILEAWEEAVFSPTFKPGKRLLGWTHPDSTYVLDVETITPEMISSFVKQYDDMARDTGRVLRSDGIPFARPNFYNPLVEQALNGPNYVQKRRRVEYVSIVKDLAHESALRQHVKAGVSLDEPVHDPAFLLKRYEEAGGQFGECNYPMHTLEHIANQEQEHLRATVDSQVRTTRDILRDCKTKKIN